MFQIQDNISFLGMQQKIPYPLCRVLQGRTYVFALLCRADTQVCPYNNPASKMGILSFGEFLSLIE
jgi:hypothetical protein